MAVRRTEGVRLHFFLMIINDRECRPTLKSLFEKGFFNVKTISRAQV